MENDVLELLLKCFYPDEQMTQAEAGQLAAAARRSSETVGMQVDEQRKARRAAVRRAPRPTSGEPAATSGSAAGEEAGADEEEDVADDDEQPTVERIVATLAAERQMELNVKRHWSGLSGDKGLVDQAVSFVDKCLNEHKPAGEARHSLYAVLKANTTQVTRVTTPSGELLSLLVYADNVKEEENPDDMYVLVVELGLVRVEEVGAVLRVEVERVGPCAAPPLTLRAVRLALFHRAVVERRVHVGEELAQPQPAGDRARLGPCPRP